MLEPAPDAPALPDFSDEQVGAWGLIAARLAAHGVELEKGTTSPRSLHSGAGEVIAVTGKAGSGKTLLLARLAARLAACGLAVIRPDYEPKRRTKRSFAVLAPTNKAASVLRRLKVPATTVHRVVYTPVYDPEFQKVADWLEGERKTKPIVEGLSAEALDRAEAFYKAHGSVAGALAAAGVRSADFIKGWTRRRDPLDIALVDEASMIDAERLDDLRELFRLVVLFGDPAQLAPVGSHGRMVFETLPEGRRRHLAQVHRQAAGNPILGLAHALGEPELTFRDFEDMVRAAARTDPRVRLAQSADADLMCESPMLVWRNRIRARLIAAFRAAHGIPENELVPGEPLICDGLELPARLRRQRIELETRGLIKGAQASYLGPGNRPGFVRVRVHGSDEPGIGVAAIIQIERAGGGEPWLVSAARAGAVFLHGAACTVHKAQGSQWPRVQVFAPDLYAAARSGQEEAGLPLWKRLAYVAITRAEDELVWVTRYVMARPARPLGSAGALPAAQE
ncbi:MAG TPA: AAA family ATPase [Thermohalobaculum sp.]|nr:AAA family ATPase [Thermohalobaculum sp.]